MNAANSPASNGTAGFGNFAPAARFWELLRIPYNLLLVAVVALWVIVTWPHFRPALRFETLLPMGFLALVANVCYSAAYLMDFPLRHAAQKFLGRWRWIVWTAGTLFAILLANYWIADEIFPDVH